MEQGAGSLGEQREGRELETPRVSVIGYPILDQEHEQEREQEQELEMIGG